MLIIIILFKISCLIFLYMFNITVHGFLKVFFIIFNINTLKLLKKYNLKFLKNK
jgi:hypothetical protein